MGFYDLLLTKFSDQLRSWMDFFLSKNDPLQYGKNSSYQWKTNVIFGISTIKLAKKCVLFLDIKNHVAQCYEN